MTQLQRIVIVDSACAAWTADFSRSSLDGLMKWFCRRLCIDATQQRIDFVPVGPVPEGGLWFERTAVCRFSRRMESVAIDMGTYWGECLRVTDREFVWQRVHRSKSNLNYNYPVITGSRLGFQYVPWHNFSTWVIRYCRGDPDADPMWWPRLFDEILAGPRIGEPGKEHEPSHDE
ncbi:MAG: hypothetical protein ACF8R7_12310 [Phycisphaerales bacterium JB039]